MIPQASATFPRSRSFSVHVEMISRGSNDRGTRSSFTICWRRMGPRSNGDARKNLCLSGVALRRGETRDRPEGDEQKAGEPGEEPDWGGGRRDRRRPEEYLEAGED